MAEFVNKGVTVYPMQGFHAKYPDRSFDLKVKEAVLIWRPIREEFEAFREYVSKCL